MAVSTRFTAEVKAELLAIVTATQERTDWPVRRILPHLGRSLARYKAWTKRAVVQALSDRRPVPPPRDALLPEETAAVKAYALAHPKDGYRRLTWQMIDADVAYLSESTVYRVLREADLLARWKRSTHSGQGPRSLGSCQVLPPRVLNRIPGKVWLAEPNSVTNRSAKPMAPRKPR